MISIIPVVRTINVTYIHTYIEFNLLSLTYVVDNVLSSSGHNALDALAINACLLGLDKIELSNYFTAITKLSLNQTELNLQEYRLDEIEHTLNQCQSSVNDELHHMKK